ncbi:MAG: SGNH/GDSL hydrolase family protein [Pseudomonadota bacterium]
MTPKTLATLQANARPIKVVFLGDSITGGCGASNAADGSTTFPAVFASLLSSEISTYGGSYPVYRQDIRSDDTNPGNPPPNATIQSFCPAWASNSPATGSQHQIVRQGYAGRTSLDILNFLNSGATNTTTVSNADLVVVELGTNDSYAGNGINANQYVANINNILSYLSSHSVKEVLLLNSMSNGMWEDKGVTTYYSNYYNDLQLYNTALWNDFSGKAGSNAQYTIGSMSVGFFDLNAKIVGARGMDTTAPHLAGDTNAYRNMYRWSSVNYAHGTSYYPYVYDTPIDILHPNPIGYQAIAEQLFYNTLSRMPSISAPTIGAAGVSIYNGSVAPWVQGTNFTASTRVYLTTPSGKPWSAQVVPTLGNGGTLLTFLAPDAVAPDSCNKTAACTVQIQLVDLKTGLSSGTYPISIPQANKDVVLSSGGVNAKAADGTQAFWLYASNLSVGQWAFFTNLSGSPAKASTPLTISTDGTWASGQFRTSLGIGQYNLRVYDPSTSRYSPLPTIQPTAPN